MQTLQIMSSCHTQHNYDKLRYNEAKQEGKNGNKPLHNKYPNVQIRQTDGNRMGKTKYQPTIRTMG